MVQFRLLWYDFICGIGWHYPKWLPMPNHYICQRCKKDITKPFWRIP